MKNEILLQLKNVHVHYGGVKALDGVDVSLDEGEIVALMGPNGAGKSTILKAVFGLAPISSGKVLWRERAIVPVPHEASERGIAFVPQGRRVFHDLTVLENLEVGGIASAESRVVKERLGEVLELFPVLREKLAKRGGTLSGGEQQMLAFARALMSDPSVLLLDEPSLGLSPKYVKEVFEKIKEINEKRKISIMVVEHNIKSLFSVAGRVYVLDKGRVAAEGDPQTMIDSNIIEKVFLGKLES